MAPIGTIKLRSPAPPAARFGAAAGSGAVSCAARPGGAISTPREGRGRGFVPARHPRRRTQPARRLRPARQPRRGHDRFAINQENPSVFADTRRIPAGALAVRRHPAPAALASAPRHQPGHRQTHCDTGRRAAPAGGENIPASVAAAISAAGNPTRTIAYLTRKIKVGLMANRDDHVINIPVVLAWRPARSGG